MSARETNEPHKTERVNTVLLHGKPAPPVPRSGHWATVRAEHLKQQPTCQACGGSHFLEVHHIEPFHLHQVDRHHYPLDRELDPKNLITLCESATHNCHLWVGHLGLWSSWNPEVREDAAIWLAKVLARPMHVK